jgi:HD-GYP domain-containing protein (c-di-GMP phosphodiesterase class II)
VADVYDALSSRRPYKAPLPFDAVMAQLAQGAGQHFDPQVLAVFQRLAPGIQERLHGLEEAAIQSLMAGMITRHFDALNV